MAEALENLEWREDTNRVERRVNPAAAQEERQKTGE